MWTDVTVRRDGREPMGLGAAIGALVTERAWELPAAGATLRERWAAIAPELAGHVVAVGFDADSGQLTVCPESSAWATKARLEQTRVVAAANRVGVEVAGRQSPAALAEGPRSLHSIKAEHPVHGLLDGETAVVGPRAREPGSPGRQGGTSPSSEMKGRPAS